MPVLDHRIGGIVFRTETDVQLTRLEADGFSTFRVNDRQPDIRHRLLTVAPNQSDAPPLCDAEKAQLARCQFLPTGRGRMVLPPLVEHGTDNISTLSLDRFEVPLLRSSYVRQYLEPCLAHPERFALCLHLHSIIIQDYREYTIDVFFPRDRAQFLKPSYIDDGLRRLFASFLPAFSAVMLHSSSIMRDNRVAVFFAPDEGGKTTLVKSAPEGVILSDDRNILRIDDKGDVIVYGTPWGSIKHAQPHGSCGGLFLLEKGPTFALEAITPMAMLEYLWNEHALFWEALPVSMRKQAFNLMYDICCRTPAYRLKFAPQAVDWTEIDVALRFGNNKRGTFYPSDCLTR